MIKESPIKKRDKNVFCVNNDIKKLNYDQKIGLGRDLNATKHVVSNLKMNQTKPIKDKQNFSDLYEILQYKFNDEDLIRQALTRQSAIGERNPNASDSNYQRLEFFGDSVLNLIITELVFQVFPDKTEEYLTPLRSDIVKNDTLAKIANHLKLGSFLILGKGEEKQKSRENKNILADIVEAIIAAIYLDTKKDFTITKNVILTLFKDFIYQILCKPTMNKGLLDIYFQQNTKNFKKGEFRDVSFNKKVSNNPAKQVSNISNNLENPNFSHFDGSTINSSLYLSHNKTFENCNYNQQQNIINTSIRSVGESINRGHLLSNEISETSISLPLNNTLEDSALPNIVEDKKNKKPKNKNKKKNLKKNKSQSENLYQKLEFIMNKLNAQDFLKELNQGIIGKDRNILSILNYLPEIINENSSDFYIENIVRKPHNKNNIDSFPEFKLDASQVMYLEELQTYLANLQVKELYLLSRYVFSIKELDFIENSTNIQYSLLFYYLSFSLYLRGDYEYALKELILSMDALGEENEEISPYKELKVSILILKLNSKIKLAERNKNLENFDKFFNNKYHKNQKNKLKSNLITNQKVDVSKYDLEEISNLIKTSKLENDLDINFFYSALEIKFYFYAYQYSDRLENISSLLDTCFEKFFNLYKKIYTLTETNKIIDSFETKPKNNITNKNIQLNNLSAYEYSSIKVLEFRFLNKNIIYSDDKIEQLKQEFRDLNHSIEKNNNNKTSENIEPKRHEPFDMQSLMFNPNEDEFNFLFYDLLNYEFDNFISDWNDESYEKYIQCNDSLAKIIINKFGIYSENFQFWYYKSCKFRTYIYLLDEVEDENID